MLHAVCCKYRTQKNRQKFASGHHNHNFCRAISSQLRHVSTVRKKLVKQQYLHISPQYGELGPLAAAIDPVVWGTPANFNGFHVLAALLQRCRSTEANQTLHSVWPSPGLVHDVYIFGSSGPVTEFFQVQNSLCVQVLRSRILAALLHGTPAAGVSQTLRCLAQGATNIWQGDHHVGHWPTF